MGSSVFFCFEFSQVVKYENIMQEKHEQTNCVSPRKWLCIPVKEWQKINI